jgi:hypothetical protein
MIALLGSLFGLFSAAVPSIFQFFKDKENKKHELAVLSLQMERDRLGYDSKLREIEVQANADETVAIYKTFKVDNPWVDAFNSSVRPTLAYAFFIAYACAKFYAFPWTDEDMAIFSAIVTFYFGGRAFHKMRK